MSGDRILVTQDFSDPSKRALLFASELAQQRGGSVDVVYVLPDLYDGRGAPSVALPAQLPDEMERYQRFLTSELEQLVREVAPALASKATCHVLRGDPVKRIEELAQELGASTLCLGATGKGAVGRFLLGSVSQQVLRSSKLPVVIVP